MKRLPRDISVPSKLSAGFHLPLLELASALKSQELLGNDGNLPRRWRNAQLAALKHILRERLEEGRVKTTSTSITIPLDANEYDILVWFQSEGATTV